MSLKNLYHEGELQVQKRANESDIAFVNGGAVDTTILGGALNFIKQQAMLVISSLDEQGQVWTSTLFGEPGFVRALDDRTLEIDLAKPHTSRVDPLWENLKINSNIGLLIIELGSRRRYRINGQANKLTTEHITIDVERAYPNCPKYIQRRDLKVSDANESNEAAYCTRGETLDEAQQTLIKNADTLFVGSAHPEHGIDTSHRGGRPGFVHIINNRLLRIPDYSGNSMFNTLGNFTSYPYAGLVFIDFEGGHVLQLTGRPEILWDADDPQGETGGTRRYWQFDISHWQESVIPYRLYWEFFDYSPHIPERKNVTTSNMFSLIVEQVKQQSNHVKSFRLHAPDGGQLPEFQPGAHIQVKVKLPDGSRVFRHYSLFSNPDDRTYYEIAVLKETEGRGGSLYMHEHVNEGDSIDIRPPKNEFLMADNARHTILIAGGIGITPILSMMFKLTADKQSFELHYSSRTFEDLTFRDIIEQTAGDKAHFYASREPQGQRLDLQQLLSTPKAGTHINFCGPRRMITALRDTAEAQGWPSTQIHFESFGAQPLADDKPIRVHLAKSNKTVNVTADQSILDALLDAGIIVPHDCKRGECTLCTTQVLEGEPDHRDLCLSSDEKSKSMCLCVSRAKGKNLELDL